MDTDAPAKPTHAPGGDPTVGGLTHEVRITNQIMYLYPSVEEARFLIMQQLFSWQAVVTRQIRLQSSRYQVSNHIILSIFFFKSENLVLIKIVLLGWFG